jgi:hypothetical protein
MGKAGEACHSVPTYLRSMTDQRGSCLCGEVAYEALGALEHAHHCHCTYCRKAHGTPCATGALASGRRWLRGEKSVARHESSPGFYRYFCKGCGSALPGDPSAGFTFIPFGTLDTDPDVRPAFHIFVASKAPWWQISDGLRAFDGFSPGFDAVPVADLPLKDPPGTPRGSCLCGAVGFRIEGEPIIARSCHCGRCRKARGTAHATNMLVATDGLRFTRGEGELASYKIPEAKFYTQVFCRICGAKLPRVDESRGFAIVPLGALDDDPGIRLSEHIFVGSKAPWHEITDDLPRYDGPPPSPLGPAKR